MTNTQSHAKRELEILFKTTPDSIIREFETEILALCEKFGQSGQSGGSAPYTAGALSQAIKKLCLQQTIAPLTGEESEWGTVADGVNQNNRESAVFKSDDGKPYYLNAIVWKGDTEGESGNDWDTFTGTVAGIRSRQYIKEFPFTPKTFYVDVTREMLPEDWNEEPFYENEFYDTKVFEETGVKKKIIEKHRYVIKNQKQLEEVFEYYDKFDN